MGSTYKGDSPGKAVTRMRMWTNISRLAMLMEIPKKDVLVLAGEGGDVSVLNNYFDSHRIIATDLDKDALRHVTEKYKVPCFHGEVGKLSKNFDYNIAHLDFCGRISVDNINTCIDVVQNMSGRGLIGITLLKGREAIGGLKRDLWGGVSRRQRRNYLLELRKMGKGFGLRLKFTEHLLSNRDGELLNPKYLLELATTRFKEAWGEEWNKPFSRQGWKQGKPHNIMGTMKKGELGPLAKGMIRIDVLRFCIDILSEVRGLPTRDLTLGSMWTYHSRTKTDHGTPFITGVMNVDMDIPSMVQMKEYRFDVSDTKRSLEQLKNIICNSDHRVPAAHLADLFKISPGTVAAWRAHHTMGKYSFDEPPVCTVRTFPETPKTFEDQGNDWGAMTDAPSEFDDFINPQFQWNLGEYKKLKEHLRLQAMRRG